MAITFTSPDTFRVVFRQSIPNTGSIGPTLKQFDEEQARRIAGDDLQSITVFTESGITNALAAQATSDQPLEIVFTDNVTHSGTDYREGDIVRFAPRSTSPERRFNIRNFSGTIGSVVSISPNFIDKNNIPANFRINMVNRANAFPTATQVRAVLVGETSLPSPYRPSTHFHSLVFPATTDLRSTIGGLAAGTAGTLVVQLLDASDQVVGEGEPIAMEVIEGATGGSGGGVDATARRDASAAQKLAGENKARIDAIPVYAAILRVWPPNVRQHSGFQRKFQSTLAALAPGLATNAGSTGTRFTNTFRILTRLSDGTVVQLHTQGWAFTSDDRQSISWEVDASEFNQVGATSATTGIEIWGEFRAVYGGGVDELRGVTNSVFVDFGEEDAWPATRGEVPTGGDRVLPIASVGNGASGDSAKFSRDDHVHELRLLTDGGLAFDAQQRLHVTGTAVAQFTSAQQIALLNVVPDPGGISFTNEADLAGKVKTIRISVLNPELLTGDVWVQGWVQGQPGTGGRTKWASNIAGFNIVLSDANATAIASALITDGEGHVEVRLRFYDAESAGNEIERTGFNLPIVQIPAEVDLNDIDGVNNTEVVQIDNSRVVGFQGLSVWYGTKAQFDALQTKDTNTIYFYPPS